MENAKATISRATINRPRYADVVDASGSSALVAPARYSGNWFKLGGGCGSLCFDVNVVDDGVAGQSNPLHPHFWVTDNAGHSAAFSPNAITKGSGWHTFCAPISPLTNGELPDNGQGTWTYGRNTTAANWGALLHNLKTLRFSIDIAGPAPVEHLLFDNICFRPQACVEATPSLPSTDVFGAIGSIQSVMREIGPSGSPEHPCPDPCTTIISPAGTYRRCTWDTQGRAGAPLAKYIPGTGDDKTCTAGVPLDIEPRHRLFVHGIHSNGEAWNQWYNRVKQQMDYMGFNTVRDNTGRSGSYGEGTTALLSQVAELATQINDGFAAYPNGPVDVYAHSLGALKVEALLQLGYERGSSDPWFQAAQKIDRVYIFQGAHGGCAATAANGDRPNHGPGLGCPASRDIGIVNEFHIIPGHGGKWDMNKIVWNGQKHIYYVVATSNGGDICTGAKGFLCRDNEDHDGVVYARQMVPSWYEHFTDAKAAGFVSVIQAPYHYCHISGDDAGYDPPRLSNRLMLEYLGIKDVRRLVAKWENYTLEKDVTTCNERCFCLKDAAGACANALDCSPYGGPNCIPTGGGGGRGDPVDPDRIHILWNRDLDFTLGNGDEPRCSAMPSNLALWLPLDEDKGPTAFNAVARSPGTQGTHAGGPAPMAAGKVAGALCFDGWDDHVDVPAYADISFSASNFSLDTWVLHKPGAWGIEVLIDKRTDAAGSVRGYSLFLSDGQIGLQLADGTFTNYLSQAEVAADGLWHHVAVTVDRGNPAGGRFYLDGQPAGPAFDPTGHSGSLNTPAPFRVGARSALNSSGAVSAVLQGCLDEVEAFRRVLSPAEVLSIYQAGSNGKCKQSCSLRSASYCGQASVATGYAEICNHRSTPQSFDYSFQGLPVQSGCSIPGPVSFTPASGTTTVPPGKCQALETSIGRPGALPVTPGSGMIGCYQMFVQAPATQETLHCEARVVSECGGGV